MGKLVALFLLLSITLYGGNERKFMIGFDAPVLIMDSITTEREQFDEEDENTRFGLMLNEFHLTAGFQVIPSLFLITSLYYSNNEHEDGQSNRSEVDKTEQINWGIGIGVKYLLGLSAKQFITFSAQLLIDNSFEDQGANEFDTFLFGPAVQAGYELNLIDGLNLGGYLKFRYRAGEHEARYPNNSTDSYDQSVIDFHLGVRAVYYF